MDAEMRHELWLAMAEMGRARDRFFIHYAGAGREVDLRDELLVMQAAVRRALGLLGVRGESNYELRAFTPNYELESSAPAAQDGRKEVSRG